MKRLTTPLLALSLAAALAGGANADAAPKPLALGARAPMREVRLRNVDGKDVTLAGVTGKKGTLVVFTCNHCPWAKMWQGRIAEIGNHAVEQGIGTIAVNPNDPTAYTEDGFDQMQQRAKDVGFGFPYAVDATSDMARAFGASHTPEVFLFDARGRLVYHGAVDDNAREIAAVKEAWLKDAVAAVAAGRPVAVAETKALGCSIKYRARKTS